jgi:hypothetical protein
MLPAIATKIWSSAPAVAIVIFLNAPWAGSAEEPPASEDNSREVITRLAGEYRLFLGPDRVPLEMEQVLRWPNPRRATPDGATFVWTRDGRPEAIACIWNHGILSHAFHSLSTNTLVAEHNGQTVWHPDKPGIEMARVPNAAPPADSASKRLAQMKEIARRFTCRVGAGSGGEELRLLPRPLYRYKTDQKDLIDGGLFAFVEGTDPEVVLVLEAVGHDGTAEWRYAITRRSMAPLEADLDGERIWAVPANGGASKEPWFHGGIGAANITAPVPSTADR